MLRHLSRRRQGPSAAASFAAEPLEARTLFATYTSVSISEHFNNPDAALASGHNDSLSFVYGGYDGTPLMFVEETDYAFINGVFTPFEDIPGLLDTDTITGVNDSHLIVGTRLTADDLIGVPFVVESGVRTELSDRVQEVVGFDGGTPGYANFMLVKVGNDGSILFNELRTGADFAWLYKGGVLTFLWYGSVVDVNSNGDLIGYGTGYEEAAGLGVPVMRAADGETTTLSGLITAGAISDSGYVYGTINGRQVASWKNGVVTTLASIPSLDGRAPIVERVLGADNAGNVLVSGTYPLGGEGGQTQQTLIFNPGDGIAFLSERTSDHTSGNGNLERAITNRGVITTPERFYFPDPTLSARRLAPGSPLTSAESALERVVFGLNMDGNIVAFSHADGDWYTSALELPASEETIREIFAYTDPHNGRVHTVVFRGSEIFLDGAPLPTQTGWTSIVAHAAIYIVDQRVVIVGTDASRDLVIYYQAGGSLAWVYDNLTEDVETGGQSFVPVADGLTAFASSWNSQNIAYLDASGDVQTLWWAPGMTLWHLDNLSQIAGAPPMTGPLTSVVTPWNAFNVIGTDASGRLASIWWAPDTVWLYSLFISTGQDTAVEAASVAAFVTPWNALSIVARDATTGRTVAYWWAPGTEAWKTAELPIPSRPDGVITTGELSAGMEGPTQTIFAREAETGDLIELFWSPGDGWDWSFADITLAVG